MNPSFFVPLHTNLLDSGFCTEEQSQLKTKEQTLQILEGKLYEIVTRTTGCGDFDKRSPVNRIALQKKIRT